MPAKENTLKLKKTIEINGKKVNSLSYDFEALTAKNLNAIDRNVAVIMAGVMVVDSTIEGFNRTVNRYTFFEAVLAVNKDYDIADVERMGLRDTLDGEKLAKLFMRGSEDGEEKTSEEQSPS